MSLEIEELRARAIASMASSGNSKSRDKRNLVNAREEGELSSSAEEKVSFSRTRALLLPFFHLFSS